jgi:SpoVK/Ycf46/Vps4 family AAA+-type ATPase
MPDANERADIFKIIIKKYGFETNVEDFIQFAAGTENYTGAEIETVVRKAYEIANEDDTDGAVLTSDIIIKAIDRCRPSTQQVQFMTMLAIEECDDKDLLPEKYKGLLDTKNLSVER